MIGCTIEKTMSRGRRQIFRRLRSASSHTSMTRRLGVMVARLCAVDVPSGVETAVMCRAFSG